MPLKSRIAIAFRKLYICCICFAPLFNLFERIMLHCGRGYFFELIFAILIIMCLNNCVLGTDNLDLPVRSLNPEFEIKDSCDYINVDNTLLCDQNSLTCMQMNVRGISSKKTEVRHLIDHCLCNDTPNALLLCETWLTPFSPILKVPGYETYQHNRIGKKEGGVAILLADKYRCKTLDIKFISPKFESVFIKLELHNGECVGLGSIYRPPNTDPKKFNEEYCVIISQLKKECQNVVIGLDHNMDFLKSNKHESTQDFINQNLELGMLPMVTQPTRITKTSAMLIDNIIVSMNYVGRYSCYVLIDDISDHLPSILLLSGVTAHKKEPVLIKSKDLRKCNMEALKQSLDNTNFERLIVVNDLNTSFSNVHSKLVEQMTGLYLKQHVQFVVRNCGENPGSVLDS